MIDNRVTQMINETTAQLQASGMTLEQYMAFSGLDLDKMREEYRERAKKAVLTDLMLEQVARKEKLTVTDAELNYEIAVMAQMYRTPPKQIAKYLQANGQLPSVVNSILTRKAMQFIFDNMAGAQKPADKPKPAEEPVEDTEKLEELEEH